MVDVIVHTLVMMRFVHANAACAACRTGYLEPFEPEIIAIIEHNRSQPCIPLRTRFDSYQVARCAAVGRINCQRFVILARQNNDCFAGAGLVHAVLDSCERFGVCARIAIIAVRGDIVIAGRGSRCR